MSNIAEGFDGGTDAEFCRFLTMAKRSAMEVQSHLYAALDDAYISQAQFKSLYDLAAETKRVIGGFVRYLKNKGPK
jgi:four helix bundle protein